MISLLPRRPDGRTLKPAPIVHELDVDAIGSKGDSRTVKVAFSGRLKASLKRVRSISRAVPTSFDLAILLPASCPLEPGRHAQAGFRCPETVGGTRRLRRTAACRARRSGLRAPVAAIETGAAKHMPHGGVLSFDFSGGRGVPLSGYSYRDGADSALFTGQYLAAESFRYAATAEPRSAARA